ncbi:MAG: alpha/beta hydrolase [Dysgonamonadaceae bacterium]|jgi:pimeloyl-ACP methyl ester carboxylesterase|nr:alpha/beta hydrolase [Dysgonamonadaceae bacterium]
MNLLFQKNLNTWGKRFLVFLSIILFAGFSSHAQSFTGEKTSWHGFDRYDFVINEKTLQIKPVKATQREGNGVANPEKGTRRCIIVVPKQAAKGNPWSWRGCYWDHQPQAEIELLKRGFHIAFITTDPDETWDVWYKFLTEEHGLSPRPAFIGMSRGGANAFTWGTGHPDKVSAICADNPGLSQKSLMSMDLLAANDVPLLNICGSIDPILNNTYSIQGIYHGNGGRMSVLIKDGSAHHPHSLQNPNVIADFIEQSFKETPAEKPAFVPERFKRTHFYSTTPRYAYAKDEKLWITSWGPYFTGNYQRYAFSLQGVEGSVTVITPQQAAQGNPWIFRCQQQDGHSAVDLELLARGFHIVVAPVPYNADGPLFNQWTSVYNYLTEKGFSQKPILAGSGAATGEVYAWAIENPDKVSGIYGENPILRSSLAKIQPLDNLKPLATAKIPILHACGSLDPNLKSQTNEVKKRYSGKMTVILDAGRAHYPMEPNDPQKIAGLIENMINNSR